MDTKHRNPGNLYGILAALLFGASTPAAKYLLGNISPWLLAGLLYLGSGLGLFVLFCIKYFFKRKIRSQEDSLKKHDWKWLAGAILTGGMLGPIFLMLGLIKTNAAAASLLLNLEMVFSILLAWLIFKEHISLRIFYGMILILIGSCLLSWKSQFHLNDLIGPLFIAAACLAWGIDNNITRNISASNPTQIAMLKSLIAGLTNTLLAITFGAKLSSIQLILFASLVGFIGYGVSLLFFILALRNIGTARTSSYFSLAPFFGAGLAIIFLSEPVSLNLVLSSVFMIIGIWLHLTEKHEHEHEHPAIEHSHKHYHDRHHQHAHRNSDPKNEPHTHWHNHKPLKHSHPHYPDVDHRHKH